MTIRHRAARAPAQRPERPAGRVSRLLAGAWGAGLLPEPRLEADALAPGIEGWRREALERLLLSLGDEAALNPLGRTMAWGQLRRAATAARRAEALWARHPEIGAQRIKRPVIVLGHMRSGTTRIHRLLACDPRLRHTRFYESLSPVPGRGPDLRRAGGAAGLVLLQAVNPALAAIHPTSASAPEEEFGLFAPSFFGAHYEAQWRIPGFARWWEGRDRRPVYADFLRLLQTVAWTQGGRGAWLLKVPQFMEDMELVLGLFPDARIVRLRRDPADVVASSASLAWQQMRVQSDAADKGWIGEEWLRKTLRREARAAAARRSGPAAAQIEVEYEAVNRDWRGEMGRIYNFLGMALTPAVEARMAAYLARAERSGFRGHLYDIADFGLDADEVREAFGRAAENPL